MITYNKYAFRKFGILSDNFDELTTNDLIQITQYVLGKSLDNMSEKYKNFNKRPLLTVANSPRLTLPERIKQTLEKVDHENLDKITNHSQDVLKKLLIILEDDKFDPTILNDVFLFALNIEHDNINVFSCMSPTYTNKNDSQHYYRKYFNFAKSFYGKMDIEPFKKKQKLIDVLNIFSEMHADKVEEATNKLSDFLENNDLIVKPLIKKYKSKFTFMDERARFIFEIFPFEEYFDEKEFFTSIFDQKNEIASILERWALCVS